MNIWQDFVRKSVLFLEKDGTATVTDNGRGIPVDMHQKGISAARLVFTTLHAGENLTIRRIRQAEVFMASVLLL